MTKEQLDKLYDQADKKSDEIEYLLKAYMEESVIHNVVTDKFNSIEHFIGDSILETCDGATGYLTETEDPEVNIFIQFYSDGKRTWTYFEGTKVTKVEYVIIDKEIDTPVKKLEQIVSIGNELIKVQKQIDDLESKQADI